MAQLKSRTQTPAPSSAAPDPSHPPLPPASHFDILPPLHALLSRLEPSLNTYTPDASADAAQGTPLLPSSSHPSGSGTPAAGTGQALNYKDAAVAAQFLKTRIRRVLLEVSRLEDMERTVEEQEVEIAELEGRIRGQREVLEKLGRVAGGMVGELEGKSGGGSGS